MPLRLMLMVCSLGLCTDAGAAAYSPPVRYNFPSQVFWGDTHLHTALSGDAFRGGTRLGLDDAYRFARGEQVMSNTGQPARLSRPLDFVVIADHANNVGAAYARHWSKDDPTFRETAIGRMWQQALAELEDDASVDQEKLQNGPLLPTHRPKINQIAVRHRGFRQVVWETITKTADRYNDPGTFTTLNGYEWTSGRGAVHRVIIFKDDAGRVNRVLPFSSYDSENVEELWTFLDGYEKTTGGSVLAIPHNSNLTFGLMFDLKDSYGNPLDRQYASIRSRWEPLMEITQIKGDSETHPLLSPDDVFADYETWNGWAGSADNPMRPPDRIKFEYARSALKLGLSQQASIGVNPFKFGVIGSTDSHTALAAVEEDNFWGKMGASEPSTARMVNSRFAALGPEASAAGYAAVWATANTRDEIFDAMRRKETYATTGPRMTLRFFGGWRFELSDAKRPDLTTIGYTTGVPMGADLTHAPAAVSPRFLVHVARDPLGAYLDRVQIVKGWRTPGGEVEERVHNVA